MCLPLTLSSLTYLEVVVGQLRLLQKRGGQSSQSVHSIQTDMRVFMQTSKHEVLGEIGPDLCPHSTNTAHVIERDFNDLLKGEDARFCGVGEL